MGIGRCQNVITNHFYCKRSHTYKCYSIYLTKAFIINLIVINNQNTIIRVNFKYNNNQKHTYNIDTKKVLV